LLRNRNQLRSPPLLPRTPIMLLLMVGCVSCCCALQSHSVFLKERVDNDGELERGRRVGPQRRVLSPVRVTSPRPLLH